jgi:hypothetical protein
LTSSLESEFCLFLKRAIHVLHEAATAAAYVELVLVGEGAATLLRLKTPEINYND